MLNNGDGTFGTAVNYPAGNAPSSVAVGDFNGDGHLDLAVTNSSCGGPAGCVSILLGNGYDGFGAPVSYPAGASPSSIAIADFNVDGKMDLAVANTTSNDVSILLGNGDGTFGALTNFPAGNGPSALVVGTFNLKHDWNSDLAVADSNGTNISVLLGNGDGTFGAASSYATGGTPVAVSLAPFNYDGYPDLVVANSSSSVSFLLGDGNGGFGAPFSYSVGSSPNSFATITGGDIAVGVSGANDISVFRNLPVPTPYVMSALWLPVGSTGTASIATVDAGSTYNWSITNGTITSGQGTSTIQFAPGAPGTEMTLSATETINYCTTDAGTRRVMADFLDVPPSYLFHDPVANLVTNGVTAGCGDGNFCPDDPVLRSETAILLLRGKNHDQSYVPPPAVGIFADVPVGSFGADFIEALYNAGITGGCGTNPLRFCPNNSMLRSELAILMLRTQMGGGVLPPPATGLFADVPPGSFAADFIEPLYPWTTNGCATNPLRYCPNETVTRGMMAAFVYNGLLVAGHIAGNF